MGCHHVKTRFYRVHFIGSSLEEGLRVPQKPKYARTIAKKKHRETEIKELEARVDKLEKMIEFLKKTQFVDKHGRKP